MSNFENNSSEEQFDYGAPFKKGLEKLRQKNKIEEDQTETISEEELILIIDTEEKKFATEDSSELANITNSIEVDAIVLQENMDDLHTEQKLKDIESRLLDLKSGEVKTEVSPRKILEDFRNNIIKAPDEASRDALVAEALTSIKTIHELKDVLDAVRLRQGFMLPRGFEADSEVTIQKMHEINAGNATLDQIDENLNQRAAVLRVMADPYMLGIPKTPMGVGGIQTKNLDSGETILYQSTNIRLNESSKPLVRIKRGAEWELVSREKAGEILGINWE